MLTVAVTANRAFAPLLRSTVVAMFPSRSRHAVPVPAPVVIVHVHEMLDSEAGNVSDTAAPVTAWARCS